MPLIQAAAGESRKHAAAAICSAHAAHTRVWTGERCCWWDESAATYLLVGAPALRWVREARRREHPTARLAVVSHLPTKLIVTSFTWLEYCTVHVLYEYEQWTLTVYWANIAKYMRREKCAHTDFFENTMEPGTSTLRRTPVCAHSSASVRVMFSTPARAAPEWLPNEIQNWDLVVVWARVVLFVYSYIGGSNGSFVWVSSSKVAHHMRGRPLRLSTVMLITAPPCFAIHWLNAIEAEEYHWRQWSSPERAK